MDEISETLDVAVFFDFENIVYSLRNNFGINANFEDLMDKCNEFGRVVVARAFADWNRQSSAMIPALMSNGFDPVYVPSFYTNENGKKDLRKNAVDMYMAIDAMDVLHNRTNVDTIILLTGDSDFLPLVNAIRRAGNRVIAIGVDGTVSSHLAQAVDEFIFYSQVSNLPANKFKKRPTNIYDGLSEAIKKLQRDNRSTVLPNVKMMMGELLGGFDEKKHSDGKGRRFQKFKEFVQEAEKRGVVQLITTGTVNEVFLAEDAPRIRETKEDSKTPAKKAPSSVTLDEAFNLLVSAVERAAAENRSMRTSSIKGLMLEKNSSFNQKNIVTEDGDGGFNRFSDFLQAAKEKGLVELKGKSTRMEIYPASSDKKDGQGEEKAKESAAGEKSKETKAVEKSQAETAPKPVLEPVNGSGADKGDFAGRQLIIESLRNFTNYPASFLQIEAYCRQLRNERKIQLPSPKVRELLTEATRQLGILKRISPPGVSPAQYGLNDEPALVADFLGIEVAQAPAAPAAAEEAGEQKEEKPKKKSRRKSSKKETASKSSTSETADDQKQDEKPAGQMTLSSAYGLLVEAINNAMTAGKSQKLAAVKRQIKQLNGDFQEGNIDNEQDDKGFKRFSDFIAAAARDGIVTTSGKGAQAEVHLVEE